MHESDLAEITLHVPVYCIPPLLTNVSALPGEA